MPQPKKRQSLSLKPDCFRRLYAWYVASITGPPSCFFAIFRGLDFFAALFADFFGALAIDHLNRSTLNLSAKRENASINVCGVEENQKRTLALLKRTFGS